MINKISMGFYFCDLIKYRGKEWVEDSFKSVADQIDDVIIVDYDSSDQEILKELCDKYNFHFFVLEKTPNILFYTSKMANKMIFEAEHDIFIRGMPDTVYPPYYAHNICDWFEKHDPTKELLFEHVLQQQECPTSRMNSVILPLVQYGLNIIYYNPFLLKARGSDERLSFGLGEHIYGKELMTEIFNLKPSSYEESLYTVHRKHKAVKKRFEKVNIELQKYTLEWISPDILIQNLINDFDKNVKLVKNSYW